MNRKEMEAKKAARTSPEKYMICYSDTLGGLITEVEQAMDGYLESGYVFPSQFGHRYVPHGSLVVDPSPPEDDCDVARYMQPMVLVEEG